jgi:putative copper export protein/mono/diheme cytochrome c family protein
VTALAVLVRALHLAAAAAIAGGAAGLLVVGRPGLRAAGAQEAAAALDRLAARVLRAAALVACLTLLLDLWLRVMLVTEATPAAAVAPSLLGAFARETRYGQAVVARLAVAVALVAVAWRRDGPRARAALALGGLLLLAHPFAGHAASADTLALRVWQGTAGALHALAAGLWLGALPVVAFVLRRAPQAAEAALRRMSALGLGCVSMLLATGVASAFALVGDLPGLVGTPYGRLLLAKLSLVVPLLFLAARNLRAGGLARVEGALRADAPRRIGGRVAGEVALGAAILALAASLATTPPAAHTDPVWPFDVRLTGAILAQTPILARQASLGALTALLGLSVCVYGALFRAQRGVALVLGAFGLAASAVMLAPLVPFVTLDAYPTTYARPAVPYHVASVASGLRLFAMECAGCHGPEGRGDGKSAAALPVRPADLTAAHVADHTAGDLFWWISHGVPRPGGPPVMPGFAGRLAEDERWDLVNAVRALAGAAAAARLTADPADQAALARAAAPLVQAPDATFPDDLPGAGTLAEARGRVVLLVFPAGAGAGERVARLRQAAPRLRAAGLDVVVLDQRSGDGPAVYRRLAAAGRPAAHLEALVDPQGYLRARWQPGDAGPFEDPERLAAVAARLLAERPAVPPAGAHVH